MQPSATRRPMNTLAVRAATGLPLAAGVLLVVLLAPLWALAVLMAAGAGLGMYEYQRIMFGKEGAWRHRLGVALAAALPLAAMWGGAAVMAAAALAVLARAMLAWGQGPNLAHDWDSGALAAWGVVYCGGLFSCLLMLAAQADGRVLLLFTLLCVVAADVGAYFAGHLMGRRKLAPSISPGKTIEGVAGGALLAVVLGAVYAAILLPDTGAGLGALLALVLALVSVAGDLLESAMKRARGVKDSGSILPGHGGILDRVDGLLAGGAAFLLIRMLWWS